MKPNIYDVLRDTNARVKFEDRWLVMDDEHYEIYEKKYRCRTKMVLRTPYEGIAMLTLMNRPKEE